MTPYPIDLHSTSISLGYGDCESCYSKRMMVPVSSDFYNMH